MALIFLPGVSTAQKVSDVSGRGVGMDVVKTNLDRLGGKIEIDSTPGRGSRFRIKLPLTLAIIPSLLISDGGQRFAIPQVSVGELIRIPHEQIAQRTDRVGDAEVLNLRDRMVPLVHLADALGEPRPDAGHRALNVVLVDTGRLRVRPGGGGIARHGRDRSEAPGPPSEGHSRLRGRHHFGRWTGRGNSGCGGAGGTGRPDRRNSRRQLPAGGRRRGSRRQAIAAAVPQRTGRAMRRTDRRGFPHRTRSAFADRVFRGTPHHAAPRASACR